MPTFSLVLPIHNQAETIATVVKDIERVLEKDKIDFELVLVENGSTDETLPILSKLAKSSSRRQVLVAPMGYGSAVIAGLREARGNYVGYMPSDGQLSPDVLPKLLKLVELDICDVAKIRRVNRESTIRFIRSRIFNWLARIVLGNLRVWDINGSPRVFKRSQLEQMRLTYKDSFIDTEFAVKARHLNLRIIEIPVANLPRLGGKSTVGLHTILEFLRNLILYRLKNP